MRRLFIFLFFTTPILALAQNITGVWHGHFRSNNVAARSSAYDDRYKFEVQIAQNTKTIEAVTYSYLSSFFYGKAAAQGTINVHTGKVLIQEGKMLELRNAGPGGVCIMTCFLQYSKSGDEEFLEGTYSSMGLKDSSNCGRGTVFLRKVASSDFYEEPFLVKREKEIEKEETVNTAPPAKVDPRSATGSTAKTKASTQPKTGPPATKTPPPKTVTARAAPPARTPVIPPAARTGTTARRETPKTPPDKSAPPMARTRTPNASIRSPMGDSGSAIGKKFALITPQVLRSRTNQLVKNLVINTNEVVLNIYDDGAIDHDTISVYLDNKQVINHAMLTDRPIILTLHLDESNDYHELVMVAENEGEIPPNTSLMIVKAGDKEYEVRITSSEQKNAVVTFKYEKRK